MTKIDEILLELFQDGGLEESDGFGWSNAESYTKGAKQALAEWVRSEYLQNIELPSGFVTAKYSDEVGVFVETLLADLEVKDD